MLVQKSIHPSEIKLMAQRQSSFTSKLSVIMATIGVCSRCSSQRFYHGVPDALKFASSQVYIWSWNRELAERERVIGDPKVVVPAAFVSFRSRWGASVCDQTQQTRNPTLWLTEWAPEPRDVFWDNLAIPFVELNVRRLVMAVALFGLTFCFMIPIAIVQTLANIESIEKVLPFLKPIIQKDSVKSFIQGFLPGIVLKIFLIVLPMILMAMSKIEGFTAVSALEARSAGKYHLFLLVNVFLGSIITGTALQQLKEFLNQSPSKYAFNLLHIINQILNLSIMQDP